jgi:exonuclease III
MKKIGASARQKQTLPANIHASSTIIKPHTEIIQRKPIQVTRHQYPFILAWSVTIHKVQGMTTHNITVSLSTIFKPGMGYVALSRVTSLEGLFLVKEDYDENKIYCDISVHKALQLMPDAKTLPQWTAQVNLTSLNSQCILISHNIEGLIPHLQDFSRNVVTHQSDIIALQETWTAYVVNQPLPYYSLHLQPRNYSGIAEVPDSLKTTTKGGVGFYIHQDFAYEIIHTEQCGIECIAAKFPSLHLSVYNVYRPPQLPLLYFVRKLTELLQNSETAANIVVGDFNVNIVCDKNNLLHKEMAALNYKQLITQPTTAGRTIIDHIYVNNVECVSSGVIPTYYSYHDITYIAF